MKSPTRSLLLLAALSLAALPSASADILVNGGFESGDFSGWTQGGNFNTSTSYTAVVPSNPSNGYYVYSGSYAAAIGPQGTPGTLSQTFTDTLGQIYNLTFAVHGDANDGLTSNFFDTTVGFARLNLSNLIGGYQIYSLNFIGLGVDTLNFSFLDNDNYLALDSVAVVAQPSIQPSATPEPSSLLLLGTGSLIASWLTRKKIARKQIQAAE